jgi:hypothetical protein
MMEKHLFQQHNNYLIVVLFLCQHAVASTILVAFLSPEDAPAAPQQESVLVIMPS